MKTEMCPQPINQDEKIKSDTNKPQNNNLKKVLRKTYGAYSQESLEKSKKEEIGKKVDVKI